MGTKMLKNAKSDKAMQQEALSNALLKELVEKSYQRGIALAEQGKHKGALVALNKAVEMKTASAWKERGIALLEIGREKDADECFKKADEILEQEGRREKRRV